jgi:hypothetical protein
VGAVALAALAVATMLATQGCDAETSAQTSPTAHPDMTFAQARAVYQSYLSTSDTAAVQGDESTGLSIVADAAWASAHAQYTALTSAGIPVDRYVYGTPTYYVPIVSGYPRWFVVAVPRRTMGASQPGSVETLMVFGESARAGGWTLDGAAALQPGQTMPAIQTNSKGYAIALSPYDQSLLVAPNVLGAAQAAVVDEGPQSASASLVGPGPQTTDLYNQQSAIDAATPKNLEYTWYMEGAAFPVFALQTTSGAALVLYGLYLNTTVQYPDAGEGTPIPIRAGYRPLLATPTEIGYHAVYANWTYQFATVDPPATGTTSGTATATGSEAEAKATVIAAAGTLSYTHAY